MGLRFATVFIYPPSSHVFSDPQRHWDNAGTFLHPTLFGSADPIMYQAYLGALRFIAHDNALVIGICTGVLSAVMPWLWYKGLREILPDTWALCGGIALALTPSLFMIYSYYMQETLLLTLIAAAVWLSFRAMRLGTLGAYTWAAVVWTLACYTRIQAIPMAGVFLFLMCLRSYQQIPMRVMITVGLFGGMMLPACWHSRINLHFCAPFGQSYINEIYWLSGRKEFRMEMPGIGEWVFGAPNYSQIPLAPFSTWSTPRRDVVHVTINPEHGRDDWEAALTAVKDAPKPFSAAQAWKENLIYLFFAPSWPDNNDDYVLGWLSMQSRWLILPMTLLVVCLTLRHGRTMEVTRLVLPGLALLMILLFMLQQFSVMEGRYRKAAEPLLIAGLIVLLYERRESVHRRQPAEGTS